MQYILKRTNRKKTIGFKINYKGELVVSAPKTVSISKVETIIAERKNWIEKKQKEILNNLEKNPAPVYKPNSEHLFLGEMYLLKVEKTNYFDVQLNTEAKTITIFSKYDTEYAIEQLLYQFYKFESIKLLHQRVELWFPKFVQFKVKKPKQIKARRMKTMWGNCRPQTGILTFNSELIRADIDTIDYVVVHELCHLVHPNHSKDFYALQASFIPNWKDYKELLKTQYRIFRD